MSGTSIDNKVVSIEFDNKEFETKIAETLKALDDLNRGLLFKDAGRGFADVTKAADGVNLSRMGSNIDHIANRISALGAIGFSVIQNLTSGFLGLTGKLGHAVLDPLIEGGKSRALNIDNAKFQFRGLGLDVEAAMASAKKAVLGTAYGLDVAAKAAAQFGASGVKVGDEMTTDLRAIAGIAAMTNSSFSEISDIFTSSAGTGVFNNQDLQQFATRGLNAAAALAKQMGITEAQVHEMATAGKLDFKTVAKALDDAFGDHATKANETYTGSLANMKAALSRIGAAFETPFLTEKRDLFNALTPQIDNFGKAIKPLVDVFSVLSRVKMDNLIKGINGINFDALTYAAPALAKSMANIYEAVKRFIAPIKFAFRSIFPPKLGANFILLAARIAKFTDKLKLSGSGMAVVVHIFSAIFSVLKIGIEIVKGIGSTFKLIFDLFKNANGGRITSFLTGVADAISGLRTSLVDGGGIAAFFQKIQDAIKLLVNTKDPLSAIFKSLFGGIPGASAAEDVLGRMAQRFGGLVDAAHRLGAAWDWLKDKTAGIREVLGGVVDFAKGWVGDLVDTINNGIKPGDFDTLLDALNVGILVSIAAFLHQFLDRGISINTNGGIFGKISANLTQLKNTLHTMQIELKVKILMEIAKAVALLTVSVVALSLIDSGKLTRALTALAVGMGQLVTAMYLLDKIASSVSGAAQLELIAAGMILIAGAALILSLAVTILSRLSWSELAKGLVGVGVSMAILVGSMKLLEGDTGGMIRAGIAMIGISAALLLLSAAVKEFGKMNLKEMGKGLLGIAASMLILTLAMRSMPKLHVADGLAMIGIAAALLIMSKAVESFSKMSLKELGKGLLAVAVTLAIVVAAMNLMPGPTMAIAAAGLVLVGIALNIMVEAVKNLAEMKLGDLAKGLGAVAALMLVVSLAAIAMTGALPGAIAMIIISGALLIFAAALKVIGALSIGQLVTGLVAFAATMVILALASNLLIEAVPGMLAFGAALIVLGAGFALIGVGAYLVAKAIDVLAKTGKAGVKALVEILKTLVAAIPDIIKALADSIIHAAESILKAIPVLLKIIITILDALLDGLIKLIPKLVKVIGLLLLGIIRTVRKYVPLLVVVAYEIIAALLRGLDEHAGEFAQRAIDILEQFINTITDNMQGIIDAGVNLIVSFLSGISDNADPIVDAVVGLITSFIDTVSENIQQIIDAGVDLVVAFIAGLGGAAESIVAAGAKALSDFIQGISDSIQSVIDKGVEVVVSLIAGFGGAVESVIAAGAKALSDFLQGLQNNIQTAIDKGLAVTISLIAGLGSASQQIIDAGAKALSDFIEGVGRDIQDVIDKGVDVVISFIAGLGQNAVLLTNAAADVLVDFLNGMASAIRTHNGEIHSAGQNLASAILEGLTYGLSTHAGDVVRAIVGVAKGAIDAAKRVFGINSPSKEFMKIGASLGEGLAKGVNQDTLAGPAVRVMANKTIGAFQDTFKRIGDAFVDIHGLNPVIAPVLDLSNIESEAGRIASLINGTPITPDVSFDQARYIMHTNDRKDNDVPTDDGSTGGDTYNYNQTIISPKALSTNEIYKGTKSQLAKKKEELSIR